MAIAGTAGVSQDAAGQSRIGTVMPRVSRNTFVASCLACLVAGYLVACVPGFDPINPFRPKHDRPVVRFFQRLAKIGLWVAVFADPPPQPYQRMYRENGNICHAEGW